MTQRFLNFWNIFLGSWRLVIWYKCIELTRNENYIRSLQKCWQCSSENSSIIMRRKELIYFFASARDKYFLIVFYRDFNRPTFLKMCMLQDIFLKNFFRFIEQFTDVPGCWKICHFPPSTQIPKRVSTWRVLTFRCSAYSGYSSNEIVQGYAPLGGFLCEKFGIFAVRFYLKFWTESSDILIRLILLRVCHNTYQVDRCHSGSHVYGLVVSTRVISYS